MNKSMIEESGGNGIGNLSFVKTNNDKYETRTPSGAMVLTKICRLRGLV